MKGNLLKSILSYGNWEEVNTTHQKMLKLLAIFVGVSNISLRADKECFTGIQGKTITTNWC